MKERLKHKAEEMGFVGFGVCRPDAAPDTSNRLSEFLNAGYHGTMDWMERRANWRGSPEALWPDARSIIMLAEPYTPVCDPLKLLEEADRGVISVYAQGRDYHDVVKRKLKQLGRWLIEEAGGEIKVFVDTAPVMEKPLGAAAGLGWQGKHTNLVSRNIGNWFFLGAIFTTLEIQPDRAAEDHCGSCRACLDICPTNAFPAPYKLDARRCISYLTIEHDGPIDEKLRAKMGNRIYGCDDCLAVCPWNKFAQDASNSAFFARVELQRPRLSDLAELDDASFRILFSGSPIKRIGRDRFIRNVLYAIGNSNDPALIPSAKKHVSDANPVVADAASWAVEQLTCS